MAEVKTETTVTDTERIIELVNIFIRSQKQLTALLEEFKKNK